MANSDIRPAIHRDGTVTTTNGELFELRGYANPPGREWSLAFKDRAEATRALLQHAIKYDPELLGLGFNRNGQVTGWSDPMCDKPGNRGDHFLTMHTRKEGAQ